MTVIEQMERLAKVKAFLERKLTTIRNNSSSTEMSIIQVDNQLSRIHSFERKGIRNLGVNELEKLNRILSRIEEEFPVSSY